MLLPSLSRAIKEQRDIVENVPAQNTLLFLNQQILTSEDALQENHVQCHGRRKTLAPVETHEFVTLARDQRDADPLNRLAGQ